VTAELFRVGARLPSESAPPSRREVPTAPWPFAVHLFSDLTAPSEEDCARTMVWGSVGILVIWIMLMCIGVLLFAYNVVHPGAIPPDSPADHSPISGNLLRYVS
jgi:hypothetical protein